VLIPRRRRVLDAGRSRWPYERGGGAATGLPLRKAEGARPLAGNPGRPSRPRDDDSDSSGPPRAARLTEGKGGADIKPCYGRTTYFELAPSPSLGREVRFVSKGTPRSLRPVAVEGWNVKSIQIIDYLAQWNGPCHLPFPCNTEDD